MRYCPLVKDYINDCEECEMCPDEETEEEASPDYPLGGSLEPYDIERDKELDDQL